MDPLSVETWPNRNFDQDANGRISALDALRVINYLAAQQNGQEGEGELAFQLIPQSPHPVSHPWVGEPHPEVSHSPLHLKPSDSQTPLTSGWARQVNPTQDDFQARISATDASESQSSITSALLFTDSEIANTVDDVLKTWQ